MTQEPSPARPGPDPAVATDVLLTDRLVGEDPDGAALRAATAAAGLPDIAVSPTEGKFLAVLARLAGATRVLEVGTLGGYSTLWLARAVGPGGSVVTLEADPEHAAVARSNLDRAGVGDRVEIVVGPARETLPRQAGPFGAIFVDADKENDAVYVRDALALAVPGAVVVVDNVVRGGAVADPGETSAMIRGCREVLDLVRDDPRLEGTALQTVGARGHDGMLVALVTAAPGPAAG